MTEHSINELAYLTGVNRATLTKRAKTWRLEKDRFTVADFFDLKALRPCNDSANLSPSDRKNLAQAEKLELETSILRGTHIPMHEHEERFARTMLAIKNRVRSNREMTNDTKRDLLELIKLTIGQVDDEYTAEMATNTAADR